MELFLEPGTWIALLTLTFLEIVLGVDNIIFISIVSNKLPEAQRPKARNIGLSLALLMRIGMLFGITWIITFTEQLFTFPYFYPFPRSTPGAHSERNGLHYPRAVSNTLQPHTTPGVQRNRGRVRRKTSPRKIT